ncbi:MAG: hypothetical protein EAZ09_14475 [Oscillatoriales cyanobacterium]|nr:MAG: hypothetical protein EAZ09_14475 [Oscillatoriales cyanobacterium]
MEGRTTGFGCLGLRSFLSIVVSCLIFDLGFQQRKLLNYHSKFSEFCLENFPFAIYIFVKVCNKKFINSS